MGGLYSTFFPEPIGFIGSNSTSTTSLNSASNVAYPPSKIDGTLSIIQREELSNCEQLKSYRSRYIAVGSWNAEFLYTVFQWNTKWFSTREIDQSIISSILGDKYCLNNTLLVYDTLQQYINTFESLMVYEFFYVLSKDINDKHDNLDPKDTKIEPRCLTGNITHCQLTLIDMSDKIQFKTFKIVKIFENIDALDNCPVPGDLLYIEYNDQYKIFGCLVRINKKTSQEKIECVYTVFTKNESLLQNQEVKLISVKSMKTEFRSLRALKDLSESPLHNFILKPNYYNYDMACANEYTNILPLLSGQKLNKIQLEVVANVVKTVESQEPKICLVHGPPGTGKTTIIVAIIAELMKTKRSKILLCAQSNKAVDGVLLKLLSVRGILEKKGVKLNIVRIGPDEKMDPEVKDVSLSMLMETKLINQGMANLSLSTKKSTHHHRWERKILNDADVIVSTLSSCYSYHMERLFGKKGRYEIPVCIVDEAGQCTEVATLIPLLLGVKTLILLGDPQQLPPTIISQIAKKKGMNMSLFARAQKYFKNEYRSPIKMLNVQYRMVNIISQWPNRYFYANQISNAAKNPSFPVLCHYRVLNHDADQSANSNSNISEASIVMNLLEIIINQFLKTKTIEDMPSIGVITPYNNQRDVIQNMVTNEISKLSALLESEKIKLNQLEEDNSTDFNVDIQNHNNSYCTSNGKNNRKKKEPVIDHKTLQQKSQLYDQWGNIQVNTVDSFQGQERDIIIMSCVRSKHIGFVADPNRLNVSLTRAKHTMIICGNFNIFRKNRMWQNLLVDAEYRGAYENIHQKINTQALKNLIFEDNGSYSK